MASTPLSLTTQFERTASALRRVITLPYVQQFNMTVAEWRLLSTLAGSDGYTFKEAACASATDKSLVSRTLRKLETRGWIDLVKAIEGRRRTLRYRLSQDGRAIHDQVLPMAQRAQAAVIRTLTNKERRVLHTALAKLQIPRHNDGC